MAYYLSVDGGGSSTTFLLTDELGTPVRTVKTGSTSFKSVGVSQARENIQLGLDELNVPSERILRGIWGLSGCDTPEDRRAYEAMLAQCGLALSRHRVLNDAQLAFWAAAQPPGAVVIAGTGSIALGIPVSGEPLRCGGLNYAFSDLGSGYWIGAQLLKETALYLEGLRQWDAAFPAVLEKLGKLPLDALAALESADQIAAFARIALETDSPVSDAIRQEASGYLCQYGKRMLTALESRTIVLAGGLFQNDRFYLQTAQGFPDCRVIRLTEPPVVGGIRMLLQERN